LANNTLLFSTSSNIYFAGYWVILESNWSHMMHFPVGYECGNNYNSVIYDIETTTTGVAYFVETHNDCPNNNYLSVQQTFHGSNVSNLNGGSWTKAIISLGMLNFSSTSFTSSPTIDWRYTWAVDGSGANPMADSISARLKFFDNDKLYWAGNYYQTNPIVWNAELGGGSPPSLTPSSTGVGNLMASIFSLNGSWLQSISN
jgi:hypothetical protein